MLFRLTTTMTFSRTIECVESEEEALAYAQEEADEANKHNHHGEVTKVTVSRLNKKNEWVPVTKFDPVA